MRRIIPLIVVLTLFTMVVSVSAQDDVEIPVYGDSESQALQVVQDFINSLDSQYLAEEVQFVDQTIAFTEPTVGREIVAPPDGLFFGNVFTDVTVFPLAYIVADNYVVAEFRYAAINSGRYYGAPATGQEIVFPMVGIFEVEDGVIDSIRVYYDTASLQQQMGFYTPAYGPGVPTANTIGYFNTLEVDDVVEEPERYLDTTVTVAGTITEQVGEDAFVIADQDLIDVSQEYIIVIPENPDEFDLIPVPGISVNVTGTVRQFVLEDIATEVQRTLDEGVFADYRDMTVIVASSAFSYDEVETLDRVIDDPTPFLGETVTVSADVGERLSPRVMRLIQRDFLDTDNFLAVDVTEEGLNFDQLTDESSILVTGTIEMFDPTVAMERYGVNLDTMALSDYTGDPVLFVASISVDNPE